MRKRLAVVTSLIVGGLALLVALLVLPAAAAPASTTYFVGPGGSDGNICTSLGTRCLTIGGALGKAAAAGDTIVVAAGTYPEHLTVNKSVTINGAGAPTTTVDGSSAGRVLTVTGGVNVVLSGLTIKHGHSASDGGGIHNSGGLVLKNIVVLTNTAALDGGGIYNRGVLSLTNTSVLSNGAANGAGLANVGPAFGSAVATLDSSLIQGNVAGHSGAGIYSTNCLCSFPGPATLTLLNHTTIKDNTATFGGGAGIYSNGTLSSTGTQFINNWSQIVVPAGYTAGGLLVAGGAATLTNDVLSSNRSTSYGGAIAVGGGMLTVTSASMFNNTAYWGGDLATSPTATVTFIGGSLSYGGATVDGGSIYNSGSLFITGTLVSHAQASNGRAGAIDNLGSLILTNSSLEASSALSEAGGLLNEAGGILLLTNDTLTSNLAGTEAGGIDNRGHIGMSNVTLQTNQASGRAGGLYNEAGAAVLALGGTIQGNQAGTDGGGLYNAGQFNASNLTLQNNHAPLGSGGGIFNVTGTLTLTVVVVQFNNSGAQTATDGGGGLYNAASAGLWVTGGRFFGNRAVNRGGGLYNASPNATLSGLAVQSNTVSLNYDEGGGLFNAGLLWLDSSTVATNTAGYDGGGLSNSGALTVTRSLIINNATNNGFGGGVYNASGTLNVLTSTISGNAGGSGGGGILNIYGKTIVVASTVSGNHGGGIANQGVSGSPGTLVMTNTTVSGNQSTGNGGGLYNDWSATLYNVTVADNMAFSGGGVYMPLTNTAVLTAQNTILAGNLGGTAPDCYGDVISQGYNLIGDNQGCQFQPDGSTDLVGTPGQPINALLAPLALNSNPNGPLTNALFVHSPALGAGSPFVSPNPSACAPIDERGVPRPVPGCDIGAFQGFVPLLQLFLPLLRR